MPFQKSNPFPSDTVVKDSIDELPDFRATESYRSAISLVEDFSEEFPLASSTGRAMGIRGRFGSGKTHLLFQLMRELAAAKGRQCKPIYAKADKVDFLDLYVNYFARKFEADDLKKVVSLHLAKLLRLKSKSWTEQGSTEPEMVGAGSFETPQIEDSRTLAQIAQEEVDQLILRDPQAVLTLVENDLLPVSGLNRDFDREIETTERKQTEADGETSAAVTDGPSNVSLDFFRAYSKLTDPNLGPLAVRWIQGSQLSNSERVDLGLESDGISQPGVAKEAMRFLLAAFKKADFAVVLCLDEFERFSSRGTAADINACAGLLKDLAEIFQKTGHLLIVAGVDDAWNAMPQDVFARIQTSYIVEMNLSEPEAKGMVDVYSRASRTSVESLFDENAFHLLYEAANHNARRILDLSYKSYELATETDKTEPARIKEDHVERAANYVLSTTKRRDAVREAIQNVASDEGLPVHTDFSIAGFTCDYVLGDQQSPKIIVEVTQSIFKVGEVSAAREIANLSQLIRREFRHTAFCVVIVGYSTKEVRDELAGVVDRVFSFDEAKFLPEFREFFKTASHRSSEVDGRLKDQEASYQDLLKKFDELEVGRRLELEQLKDALANLQAESLRTRESTREKRVTDKMEETLEQLDELLDKEEALAFPSSLGRREEQFPAGDNLHQVMRPLEEQLDHIQRAKVLNERLPRETEFLGVLLELEYVTKQAVELWSWRGWHDLSASGEVRDLFRRRKRLLNQLQGIHFSRKPGQGIAGVIQELRQNKVMIALSLLAAIGVISLVYWFFTSWSNEKAAINYYTGQVSTIQGKLRIATQNLTGDSMSSILTDTVSLRAAPYGQTYIVAPLTSSAIPKIQDGLLSANALLKRPNPEFDYRLQGELESIHDLCTKLQNELAAISLGTFAQRFFAYNWFSIYVCLSPLLVLLGLLIRKRFRRDLTLRRVQA